jgi:hypothetical protein
MLQAIEEVPSTRYEGLVLPHKTTGRDTQHHEIHQRVDGTTHRILESQNGSKAVSTVTFKHMMMASVGRNM